MMKCIFKKFVCTVVAVTFTVLSVFPTPVLAQQAFSLPAPGAMVTPSPAFAPVILRGIKIHPENPFQFDFLIDSGEARLREDQLREESMKLIKYFLVSLTVPEDDLWVNLSPYEKDRIIPDEFGVTEMGRDLLAQDYLLKQLTASLIYPENELGRKFWDRVYKRAQKLYGTTDVAISTFNKVWVLPDRAVVNEVGDTAYVGESHLKVMLEEDYMALKNSDNAPAVSTEDKKAVSKLSSQIIKELIIPEIEREVNTGKNFAQLRQVYNSLILAAWYKQALKQSILAQVYADKNKVAGVDLADKTEKEKIYQQYLEAYKKGVYNFIKEEYDPASEEMKPRKYFSGGFAFGRAMDRAMTVNRPASNLATRQLQNLTRGSLFSVEGVFAQPSGDPAKAGQDRAMLNRQDFEDYLFAALQKFRISAVALEEYADALSKMKDVDREIDSSVVAIGRDYDPDFNKYDSDVIEALGSVAERLGRATPSRRTGTDRAMLNRAQALPEIERRRQEVLRELPGRIEAFLRESAQQETKKPDVIGIFTHHAYVDRFEEIRPSIVSAVETAKALGRKVVVVWEDDRGPGQIMTFMDPNNNDPTSIAVQKQIRKELKVKDSKQNIPGGKYLRSLFAEINQGLGEMFRNGVYFAQNIPAQTFSLLGPSARFDREIQRLLTPYLEDGSVVIELEPPTLQGWLSGAKDAVMNVDAQVAKINGQQEKYLQITRERIPYRMKFLKLRDKAVTRSLENEWINKHGDDAVFLMIRGSVHYPMMMRLNRSRLNWLGAQAMDRSPEIVGPLSWLGSYDSDSDRELSPVMLEFLAHENDHLISGVRITQDQSITAEAIVNARIRQDAEEYLGEELLQKINEETPTPFPEIIDSRTGTDRAMLYGAALGNRIADDINGQYVRANKSRERFGLLAERTATGVYRIYLLRGNNQRRSNPVAIFEIAHDTVKDMTIELTQVRFERGRKIYNLTGQGIGPQILQAVVQSLPEGNKYDAYLTNARTRQEIAERFFVDDKGDVRRKSDGRRVVDPADAGADTVTLHEALWDTYIFRIKGSRENFSRFQITQGPFQGVEALKHMLQETAAGRSMTPGHVDRFLYSLEKGSPADAAMTSGGAPQKIGPVDDKWDMPLDRDRGMLTDPALAVPIDFIPEDSKRIVQSGKTLYVSSQATEKMAQLDRFAANRDYVTETFGFGLTKRYAPDTDGNTSVLVDFIPPEEDKIFVIEEFFVLEDTSRFIKSLAYSDSLRIILRDGKIFLESDEDEFSYELEADWSFLGKTVQRLVDRPIPEDKEEFKVFLREQGPLNLNTEWDLIVTGTTTRITQRYYDKVKAAALQQQALPDFTMHHHPMIGLAKAVMSERTLDEREDMYRTLLMFSLGDALYMNSYDVGWFEIRALGNINDPNSQTDITNQIYHMERVNALKEMLNGPLQSLLGLSDPEAKPDKVFALTSELLRPLREISRKERYVQNTMLQFVLGKKAYDAVQDRYRSRTSIKNVRDFVLFHLLNDEDPYSVINTMSLELFSLQNEEKVFELMSRLEQSYETADEGTQRVFRKVGFWHLLLERDIDKLKGNIEVARLLLTDPAQAWQVFINPFRDELIQLGMVSGEVDNFLEKNSMSRIKEVLQNMRTRTQLAERMFIVWDPVDASRDDDGDRAMTGDITWNELEQEGYRLSFSKQEGVPNVIQVELWDRYQQIDAGIVLAVFDQQRVVVLRQFYPNFSTPQSDEEKVGRGRAVLRQIIREIGVQGYDLLTYASIALQKSLNKLSDDGFQAIDTDGTSDSPAFKALKARLAPEQEGYEAIRKSIENSNMHGVIPDDVDNAMMSGYGARINLTEGGLTVGWKVAYDNIPEDQWAALFDSLPVIEKEEFDRRYASGREAVFIFRYNDKWRVLGFEQVESFARQHRITMRIGERGYRIGARAVEVLDGDGDVLQQSSDPDLKAYIVSNIYNTLVNMMIDVVELNTGSLSMKIDAAQQGLAYGVAFTDDSVAVKMGRFEYRIDKSDGNITPQAVQALADQIYLKAQMALSLRWTALDDPDQPVAGLKTLSEVLSYNPVADNAMMSDYGAQVERTADGLTVRWNVAYDNIPQNQWNALINDLPVMDTGEAVQKFSNQDVAVSLIPVKDKMKVLMLEHADAFARRHGITVRIGNRSYRLKERTIELLDGQGNVLAEFEDSDMKYYLQLRIHSVLSAMLLEVLNKNDQRLAQKEQLARQGILYEVKFKDVSIEVHLGGVNPVIDKSSGTVFPEGIPTLADQARILARMALALRNTALGDTDQNITSLPSEQEVLWYNPSWDQAMMGDELQDAISSFVARNKGKEVLIKGRLGYQLTNLRGMRPLITAHSGKAFSPLQVVPQNQADAITIIWERGQGRYALQFAAEEFAVYLAELYGLNPRVAGDLLKDGGGLNPVDAAMTAGPQDVGGIDRAMTGKNNFTGLQEFAGGRNTFGKYFATLENAGPYKDLVFKVPLEGTDIDYLKMELEFVRKNMGTVFAPFTILENVAINGVVYPFVMVQKRLVILREEDVDPSGRANIDGASVNVHQGLKTVIEELIKLGIDYNDALELQQFGYDPETQRFLLVDYGSSRFEDTSHIFISLQNQKNRRKDGSRTWWLKWNMTHAELFDQIQLSSDDDLHDLWATERDKAQPVQEVVMPDRAMTAKPQDVGGIDFNPANLNLEIKRDGKGMPIPFTPAELEQINIPGLVPVIINITPITNLPLFLGSSSEKPVEQLSMR